ncbi:MAG TPA: twin-arginine translocase TatA/TatE family subunit [Anaerolineaceae bacterium]|nr:twin-arginine translocase TatA/TatE family subunit [Anaerolineaceae bacterium]
MRIGYVEIIALLVIVLLLFGPGRIAKVAGELGEGIKSFKEGLSDSKSESKAGAEDKTDEKTDK